MNGIRNKIQLLLDVSYFPVTIEIVVYLKVLFLVDCSQ